MMDTSTITQSDTGVFLDRGYIFKRMLGEGSYAKVWLVEYNVISEEGGKDCNLACKIIDSKRAPRDFINRFLPREMDILAKISHPYLIHLHSIYQRKTKFFIFMRFAEKGDLLDHLIANGEVNEKQARLWTRQLALGLQYLHNLDIVHRDIKCENVLITANNNVKLGDFGFSRFMIDSSKKRLLSNTYCGSLAYAAPELIKGRPYNPKNSDVWSLGVVLYIMLNQCMPFDDNDLHKLYEMQMNSRWTFRGKISLTVSDDAREIVHRMLTPLASERIIIDDVVNHRWFSCDDRLKIMSPKEKEALEIGLSNKSEIIPKTTRLSMPSWKKRKKDEQLVCVTSMRTERSSNQFQFQTTETTGRLSAHYKSYRQSPELPPGVKLKTVTGSEPILETGHDDIPGRSSTARLRASIVDLQHQSRDRLGSLTNPETASHTLRPKPGDTIPNIRGEDATNTERKASLQVEESISTSLENIRDSSEKNETKKPQ